MFSNASSDDFKLLIDSVGEGLLIADKKGQITLVNRRCCELFGYTEEELLGQKVELLIPASARKTHVAHRDGYNAAPKKRQMGSDMNLTGLKKDGSTFHVEISLNHSKIKDDPIAIAVITDISERVIQDQKIKELNANLEKKVEERTKEVLESQRLYSAIAKNFPNGTINVFDKALKYLFVEGLELREIGIDPNKLIGTSYLDKVNQEIRPQLESEFEKVFKGNNRIFELEYHGEFYSINAVPLSFSDEEIDKILVVEENITAQKIVTQKREEALQKEKRLNEMKSRFVSMASHEFRTPLSTVLSSVSLIEKHLEKGNIDKTVKHTGRIRSAVAGLTEILNDFLSVEKLESNIQEAKLEMFDLKKFCHEIGEELDTITKEGQEIKVYFEGEDWMINSDPQVMKNICYNLLSNAIKYSKEGDEIIVKVVKSDDLTISVQDFGIGIPYEEQKDMFNRFFRAKNVTNIKGTGLGLNIVKKYLELLNGEITFVSELNEGTTFTFKIPLTHE